MAMILSEWYFGIFPSLGRIIRYHHGCLTNSSALYSAFSFDPRLLSKVHTIYVLLVKQLVKSMGTDMIILVYNSLDTFYAIF